MKTFLFVILTLFLLNSNFAQNVYYPLVDTGKTWHVMESVVFGNTKTYTYRCDGDTLLNGDSYKILYMSNEEILENWTILGYIREDTNHKVYYHSAWGTIDTNNFEPLLVYDFKAEVNDTITINSIVLNYSIEVEILITSIDSVLIDNEYRKRIIFSCIETSYNNFWIEGIGSNNGLTETGFYCYTGCPEIELLCVKEQGELIYQHEYYESCYVVGIEENQKKTRIFDICPNPADGYFNIIPAPFINSLMTFTLYNSLGEICYQAEVNPGHQLRVQTINKTSGIYYYNISNEINVIQSGKIIIK